MFFVSQLASDYPPGTDLPPNMTHMDVFMALFMVCALEVVMLKIMMFGETQDQSENSEERSIADRFFDRGLY
ncbi:unnamed protein product [Acanthoscelides obtectus]|uniref:Uncharacterized protein n=1 Tax=Acanthoscelides obtectus TaxID=200917 RepID=A0A9P0KZV5_ACAOB|nr:unnamed protein product [Acanthoscelides obtectus]CAH1995961.1 unnamed protein product [Acanthoscelides obtectus]CAK1630397.1 hypothetical protein AOBTE_LOCUS6300 [Acanthoscelides obtectus]CAK1630487.1 hypothetical protein AOBTE_LOCUS6352 [Acanthoscelides obtectus]